MKISSEVITEIVEHANTFAEMVASILSFIIPDFIKSDIGHMFTVIAPVWNPIWAAINEALYMFFGF